jgi:hypothetical protein
MFASGIRDPDPRLRRVRVSRPPWHGRARSGRPRGSRRPASVDGDTTTFWVSDGTQRGQGPSPTSPQILAVDLGAPMRIGTVVMVPRIGFGPSSFRVDARLTQSTGPRSPPSLQHRTAQCPRSSSRPARATSAWSSPAATTPSSHRACASRLLRSASHGLRNQARPVHGARATRSSPHRHLRCSDMCPSQGRRPARALRSDARDEAGAESCHGRVRFAAVEVT